MKHEQKVVPYNLRIPNKLKTRLEKQARDENRSLNQQIIHLLESVTSAEPAKGKRLAAV